MPTPAQHEQPDQHWTQKQAQQYLEARYGKNIWFAAPETIENVLERWIWAVASGSEEFAAGLMTQIEDALARSAPRT